MCTPYSPPPTSTRTSRRPGTRSPGKDIPDTPRPPLAEREARFVGDPVALVVAESRYVAEDAVDLVEVDYEPLPAIADFTKAVGSDVVVHEAYPDNVAGGMAGALPDEETFSTAAHVVQENVYQQTYVPVPIETRGMVVEWEAASGELTIWASTQTPHELRAFCARLLGLPAQHVRVIMRDTGGGFGQKVVPMREDMCIMLAARKVPGPLKWIEDRRENLMSAGQARHVNGTGRMAFDDDGNLLAVDIDFAQDVGAYPTPYPVLTTAAIGMFFPGPYRVPKASFSYKTVFSNTSGLAAYRGPWQYETLTREILLDIAARKMGMDPVELRRRNILRGDEMPYFNPNGMPYDHVAPADTFEQAVKILDHEGFRKEQRDALAQGRYIGLGFSAYIEPTGAATGHLATEGATMRMEPTGKINVYVNGGSTGNSLETTVIQLTADALGADIDDVATIQGDTAVTPYGAGTQGSRSGPMTAGAVNEAGTMLRRQLDGQAVRSCLIFAVQVDGQEVTTVEGIASPDGEPFPRAGRPQGVPRAAMRLLHTGFRHLHHRPAARQPQAHRRRDPRRPVRQFLPLHRLPGHRQRRAPGRRNDVTPSVLELDDYRRDAGAPASRPPLHRVPTSRVPSFCCTRASPRRPRRSVRRRARPVDRRVPRRRGVPCPGLARRRWRHRLRSPTPRAAPR